MEMPGTFRLGTVLELPLFVVSPCAFADTNTPKRKVMWIIPSLLARIGLAQQSKAILADSGLLPVVVAFGLTLGSLPLFGLFQLKRSAVTRLREKARIVANSCWAKY